MKEFSELEQRMYFFTIYQLIGIQKGIQSGHAALELVLKYGRNNPNHIIWDFIEKYKTWVILDGGTTNDDRDFEEIAQGTLNQIGDKLHENDIEFSFFREPDLNQSLTAICFLLDERVFNRKDYPDFVEYLAEKANYDLEFFKSKDYQSLIENYGQYYKEWVRLLGGVKNVFLRELIKNKKLA